jgi:putative flippase GtrA
MREASRHPALPGNEAAALIPRAQARRFMLFLATGGFAMLVNLVSRYLLTPITGFKASIIIAYVVGMAVAFVLFRTLVFDGTASRIGHESYRFVLVNLGALTLVWTISVTLAALFPAIGLTWHSEDIAHLIGICVPAVSSYFGHLLYTFRRPQQPQ